MTTPTAGQVFTTAAHIILSRGWTRDSWGQPDDGGPVCLERALRLAARTPAGADLPADVHDTVVLEVLRHGIDQIPAGMPTYTDLGWLFNDYEARDQAHVIELLRSCAARADAGQLDTLPVDAVVAELASVVASSDVPFIALAERLSEAARDAVVNAATRSRERI